jgi:hypothetical protein
MSDRPLLIAVCLRDTEGMSSATFSRLERAISGSSPAWSSFLNPHSFVVLFAADVDGSARAQRLVEEVSRLIATDAAFARVRVGQSEGEAIVACEPNGQLKEMPLGVFINDALARAAAV